MKTIISFCLILCLSTINQLIGQDGPAGIGNSSNLSIWLDASQLTSSDGDFISSWTDLSSNNNHAAQLVSANQPTYRTNRINGLPAIEFVNGGNDYMTFTSNISNTDITVFSIFNKTRHLRGTLLELGKHEFSTILDDLEFRYTSDTTSIGKNRNSYGIAGFSTASPELSGNITTWSGSTVNVASRTAMVTNTTSSLGALQTGGGPVQSIFRGEISEIIIYNEELNSAQRKIISSYLGGKYDLVSELSLYSFASTHSHDIKGIGQEVDGNQIISRGNDSLQITASTLSNGDYVIVGSDNGGYSTTSSVPAGFLARWNQTWRIETTGTPGNIDIEFFIDGNDFATISTNYVILTETVDGDFSNGGTSHIAGGVYDPIANSITFSNVSMTDGTFFTLGEISGTRRPISNGFWEFSSTWDCSCVPTSSDLVEITSPFIVTVGDNAEAAGLIVNSGATLEFDGSDTLSLYGDLSISGTVITGTGTIEATGTNGSQTFTNNTLTNVNFYNLISSNSSDLLLGTGGWSIENSIRVTLGVLDATGADSIVLISNASKTAEILESTSNAFVGDFIVQRFVETRNSNFGNFSSPISNGTIDELDDDVFLSGVGGVNGDAFASGGGIFRSVHKYNTTTDVHDAVTSVTEVMTPARGFEVYLASTASSFSATTIDFIGTPNSGDVKIANVNIISKGWNLIGNPYQSFVDWSLVTIPAVSNGYYIFNTDLGTYQFKTTEPIAPAQGFWVFQPNGGGFRPTFTESAKSSSTSSTFLRKKESKKFFSLNVLSKSNSFLHKMHLNFDISANSNYDELDIPELKSPIREAPSIGSIVKGYDDKIIFNSLNPNNQTQIVDISLYAGVKGEYEISTENIKELSKNYNCIFLKDYINNQTIDLSEEVAYSFSINHEGNHERFKLFLSNDYTHCEEFTKINNKTQKIDNSLSFRNSNEIFYLDYSLNNVETTILNLRVLNMSGQELIRKNSVSVLGEGSIELDQLRNLPRGMYILQVVGENISINKTIQL